MRSRKENRTKKKKIIGGVNTTSSSPFPLLDDEITIDYNITSSSDMGNTTLNTNDLSINNQDLNNNVSIIIPTENNDLDLTLDTDLSSINGNTTSEDESITFGGKRSRKLYKKGSKKEKKTRKAKKQKKTRKVKKIKNKRQRGGQGFTTSITSDPIAYKEDEYDQFKNALNYKVN